MILQASFALPHLEKEVLCLFTSNNLIVREREDHYRILLLVVEVLKTPLQRGQIDQDRLRRNTGTLYGRRQETSKFNLSFPMSAIRQSLMHEEIPTAPLNQATRGCLTRTCGWWVPINGHFDCYCRLNMHKLIRAKLK